MQKLKIQEAVTRTQECLNFFWQKDSSYIIRQLSEEVVWIGALKKEFKHGYGRTGFGRNQQSQS